MVRPFDVKISKKLKTGLKLGVARIVTNKDLKIKKCRRVDRRLAEGLTACILLQKSTQAPIKMGHLSPWIVIVNSCKKIKFFAVARNFFVFDLHSFTSLSCLLRL